MKQIFKSIVVILLVALAGGLFHASAFADEELYYKVKYKWGLINKQAGHATLTLRNVGCDYIVKLTAASEPWADHFFKVRDTLNGVIGREKFMPKFYEKIAHEGGDHKHDTVKFEYVGDSVIGHCMRRVVKDGREKVNNRLRLAAAGMTVDMMSAFYYMRSIPYDTWKDGQHEDVTIFSGKRKEILTIRYHGIETVKADKKSFKCYHITFIFTSGGGKKTSDDMDAWISADSRRIPIRLEGKLPVGKVHCVYSGD